VQTPKGISLGSQSLCATRYAPCALQFIVFISGLENKKLINLWASRNAYKDHFKVVFKKT